MSEPRPRSGASTLLVVGAVLVAVVVGAVLAGRAAGIGPFAQPQAVNRFADAPQYVDPQSGAARALATALAQGDTSGAAADQVLADQPAGIWLTPEQHPTAEVGSYVAAVGRAADAQKHVPLFVLYGIPYRDCSAGLSGGGLPADQYLAWVDAVATAAGQASHSVVVVEPDALASAVGCGIVEQRVALLRGAVDALRTAGVTTYVDAGHSDWVPAADMATMLRDVGVESVRGFSTNVSNFQSDAAETAYATTLSKALDGAHFVVDTGRNGAGSTDDWCNPPGRALGTRPGFVDDGTPLDAYLWVKPPGESDGSCGGGPQAGSFWPERAQQLVATSR